MKMSKEMENWLKALRSNKYTKTKIILRDGPNSMCALGILCDCNGMHVPIKEPGKDMSTEDDLQVQKCYNFATDILKENNMHLETIWNLNDSNDNYSFKQIANVIEMKLNEDA